jgi:hypothetical protein
MIDFVLYTLQQEFSNPSLTTPKKSYHETNANDETSKWAEWGLSNEKKKCV